MSNAAGFRIHLATWALAAALTALVASAPGARAAETPGPAYLEELGSQLTPLRGGNDVAIADARRNDVSVGPAERVLVDIYVSGSAAAAADRLEDDGMTVAATTETPLPTVEGWLPVTALGETAQRGFTDAVLPVTAGGADTGSKLSEGVAAHNIPQALAAGGGQGAGVDVGVISTSINQVSGGVAASQATGDLPANTVVWKDDIPPTDDEGRAMAEIIYDEAPAVNSIMFASGTVAGPVDKAASIDLLVAKGADVIADDIFRLDEPFFQDGVVAQAVDRARAAGVIYFASAGNRARQSYEGTYSDVAGSHDFDPGAGIDTLQTLATVPATSPDSFVQVALDWDEPLGAAQTDLDAILRTDADAALPGAAVVGGTDSNIVTGFPGEIVTWTNTTASPVTVGLRINRVAGTRSPFMKDIFRGSGATSFAPIQFPTNSDTINPDAASAKGSIAVAAVSAADTGKDTPETFSSRGPKTRLFDVNGVRLATPEVRVKPQIAAADRVSNTVPGNFQPFFSGTSAAAPSAAGIAAILMSTNPNASITEIQAQMTDPLNAIDCTLSILIPDPDCGIGFVLADRAVGALDRTGPVVTPVLVPPRPNGKGGWFTKTVRITWRATDAESPVESAPCATATDNKDGTRTFTCAAASGGGPKTGTVKVKRDTVPPKKPQIKGFKGGKIRAGKVPKTKKVKCKSSDKTSRLASCKIKGLTKRPGKHILTATATDRAGLKSVRKLRYTVIR